MPEALHFAETSSSLTERYDENPTPIFLLKGEVCQLPRDRMSMVSTFARPSILNKPQAPSIPYIKEL
jgi:hypothetical protein